MPLRRRLKNAIKKALGRQNKQDATPARPSNIAPKKPVPPPSAFPQDKKPDPPKKPVEEVQPVTPPQEQSKSQPAVEHKEEEIQHQPEPNHAAPPVDAPPPAENIVEKDASADSQPDIPEETSEQTDSDTPDVDTSGATFVYEINYLFPKTCPSCGAPSHNNWIRGDTYFACGSCNTPY